MSRLSQDARDGLMKSEFNQRPEMLELLEDRNKTVVGLYSKWNRRSPTYCLNYDQIRWDEGEHNGG